MADAMLSKCPHAVRTRADVVESVTSGFPALLEVAEAQDRKEGAGAVDALKKYLARFETLYPEETTV